MNQLEKPLARAEQAVALRRMTAHVSPPAGAPRVADQRPCPGTQKFSAPCFAVRLAPGLARSTYQSASNAQLPVFISPREYPLLIITSCRHSLPIEICVRHLSCGGHQLFMIAKLPSEFALRQIISLHRTRQLFPFR